MTASEGMDSNFADMTVALMNQFSFQDFNTTVVVTDKMANSDYGQKAKHQVDGRAWRRGDVIVLHGAQDESHLTGYLLSQIASGKDPFGEDEGYGKELMAQLVPIWQTYFAMVNGRGTQAVGEGGRIEEIFAAMGFGEATYWNDGGLHGPSDTAMGTTAYIMEMLDVLDGARMSVGSVQTPIIQYGMNYTRTVNLATDMYGTGLGTGAVSFGYMNSIDGPKIDDPGTDHHGNLAHASYGAESAFKYLSASPLESNDPEAFKLRRWEFARALILAGNPAIGEHIIAETTGVIYNLSQNDNLDNGMFFDLLQREGWMKGIDFPFRLDPRAAQGTSYTTINMPPGSSDPNDRGFMGPTVQIETRWDMDNLYMLEVDGEERGYVAMHAGGARFPIDGALLRLIDNGKIRRQANEEIGQYYRDFADPNVTSVAPHTQRVTSWTTRSQEYGSTQQQRLLEAGQRGVEIVGIAFDKDPAMAAEHQSVADLQHQLESVYDSLTPEQKKEISKSFNLRGLDLNDKEFLYTLLSSPSIKEWVKDSEKFLSIAARVVGLRPMTLVSAKTPEEIEEARYSGVVRRHPDPSAFPLGQPGAYEYFVYRPPEVDIPEHLRIGDPHAILIDTNMGERYERRAEKEARFSKEAADRRRDTLRRVYQN